MSDSKYIMLRDCVFKPQRIIKKICDPLQTYLGISGFGYASINEQGRIFNFSNQPHQVEYFYNQKLYTAQSYIRHPSLFQSGYAIIPICEDPFHQERVKHLYEFNEMFLILQQNGNEVEFFLFGHKNQPEQNARDFLGQIHLLNKFITFFKREAQTLIRNAREEGFNIENELGTSFYDIDYSLPLLTKNLKMQHFLKLIYPLSPREHQCLNLFKSGKSSQQTAAILGLTSRTVEHYFENIKFKLGCQSKWDLLSW